MGQSQKLNIQPRSRSPLVHLAGIRKSFDGKTVIDNLNLTINNGEFLTLLGPSGCGKTTVLRLIAGLENVDSGRIHLEDHDITHVPAENRHVNTVFQSYALFPHMTVFENVAFGLRMQKTPAAEITPRVMDALKMVQLEAFAQRKPHQLSGGQQQRVAIARAIVNEPRVLLLDEPLSALDRKLRRSMQLELIKIKEELGITFVFVTHDQEEALSMSDIVVVMNQGYIQQIGTPESIYNEPENAFVADFIGDSNIVDGLMVHDKLVRIADYDFECVDVGFGTNRPVDVQIRPEDMEVRPAREGGFNGVVTKVIFEGMNYNITIQARNIEWLVKSTKNYEPGDEVSLEVDPFNIQIMNKPESEDERAMEND